MLEAKRKELYESIPVPQKWHQEYINNKVSTDEYLNIARKKFDWFNY
jgi:hypothetical protein